MADEVDILSQCLEEPVATIKIGEADVVIYPAGLAELRDFFRHLKQRGLKPGDAVTLTGEEEEAAEPSDGAFDGAEAMFDHNEFMSYVFWLCIRQGTPGMTPGRVAREAWEVKPEEAMKLMGTYARGRAEDAPTVSDLAIATGLFGMTEEQDASGEAEGGEETRSSPPPENGAASGEPAE